MARRSYNQYCAAARALDLVGDRWTLLLVRELLVGPRRYSDLQSNLPGIGTNLLADRLRQLQAAGVVRRETLPPPVASSVYELTERGRGLEPVVVELARWGLELLQRERGADAWRPEWSIVAMRATFRPEVAAAVEESYQFVVDEQPFWARVASGLLQTGLGRVDAAVELHSDASTFLDVAAGRLAAAEAIATGRYRVAGDLEALGRCGEIFALPAPDTPPPGSG